MAASREASGQAVNSVSADSTLGSTLTVSHTTTGTDRLMVVGVTIRNDDDEFVTSATYDGVNLTLVGTVQRNQDARVEIWRLVAPPTGTHDVVITFNKDLKKAAIAGVITFIGVDQANPIGGFASANGDSKDASVNISSASDQLVMGVISAKNPATLTQGPDQIEWWDLQAKSEEPHSAGSTQPGAPSVTTSWTLGKSEKWALAAVTIRESANPPPPTGEYIDEVSTGTTQGSVLTIPHTTSGTDRLMMVGVSINNDFFETVSSITYAGVNLTLVTTRTEEDDARAEVWRLIAPPTGTHNVVITFSAAPTRGAVAGVITFTGVDQNNPISSVQTAEGTSTNASVTVSSAADEIVLGVIASEQPLTMTPGVGQIEYWNLDINDNRAHGAGSTAFGAPSVPISWALGNATDWAIIGLSIRKRVCTGAVATTAAVAAATHLPSNGVQYSTDFTVTNTSNDLDDFDLLSSHPGSVINFVSITGPSVVQGAEPDSAFLENLGTGDSSVVTVTYLVQDVPASTADTLLLSARSRCNPASSDAAQTALSVVRPLMNTTRNVQPVDDAEATPVPGIELVYTLITTNEGTDDAYNIVIVDSVAAEVQFKIGSVVSQLPAGMNALVEYSNDGGATWSYTPVSEGCGAPVDYDDCITHIRWSLQSALGSDAPDNTARVKFIARIE